MNDTTNDNRILDLVLMVFNDKDAAKQALDVLKEAQKEKDIEIINAATLKSDENGKVHYKELADLKFRKKGRILGGSAGVLLAVLGGPAGLLVSGVAGAAIGGGLSRLKDKGVPNDQLKEMAKVLEPNSSALVALVENLYEEQLIEEVAEFTKQVVKQQLTAAATDTLMEVDEE